MSRSVAVLDREPAVIFRRAAPPVPNAVTGDACPPKPGPERVKLTVRLPPLEDAWLDQLEDRLEEYVRQKIRYNPDPLVTRTIKFDARVHRALTTEATAAGMTLNSFIQNLLKDRRLDPEPVPDDG